MKALELNFLEIDYCKLVRGGLRIYMSGQIFKNKPYGIWKVFNDKGEISGEIDSDLMTIYKIQKEKGK